MIMLSRPMKQEPSASLLILHLSMLALILSGTVKAVNETGTDKATGNVVVRVNPQFFRPAEVELLLGNPAKAESRLGWKREISFSQLVERMVKNDMELVEKEIKAANL